MKDVERNLQGKIIDVEHVQTVVQFTINVGDLEKMINLDMPYQEVEIGNTKVF